MKLAKLLEEANASLEAYGNIDVVVDTGSSTVAQQVIQVFPSPGETEPSFRIVLGVPET